MPRPCESFEQERLLREYLKRNLVLAITAAVILATCFAFGDAPVRAEATTRDFYWQNPLPQGNSLNGVSAVDDRTAWAVGDGNSIIRTADGGGRWTVQDPGVTGTVFQGVAAVDFNTAWVVGYDGTVVRTTDGGSTWIEKPPSTSRDVNGICAIDPMTAWIVCDDGRIFKTGNGGDGWAQQAPGMFGDLYSVSAVDTSTAWLVGSGGTIAKTTNGGTTWIPQLSGVPFALNSVCAIDTDNALVAGHGGAILRTTNGGTTWNPRPSGTSENLMSVTATDPDVAWVAGNDGTVLKTTDGGATWVHQDSGTACPLMGISAIDDNTVWASGFSGKLVRTVNGGAAWKSISSGTTEMIMGVSGADSETLWVVGENGLIMRSTNGGITWLPQDSGLTGLLTDVSVMDLDTAWVVGEDGIILGTFDGGESWNRQVSGTSNDLCSVIVVNALNAWVSGDDGTVLKTTDGGVTWQSQETGTKVKLSEMSAVDLNNAWVMGADGTVLKTVDGGVNWVAQDTGTADSFYSGAAVDWKTAWAVGYNGLVMKTTDGGNTWDKQSSGTGMHLMWMSAVDDNNALAGGLSGVIIKTEDGGDTWDALKSGAYGLLHGGWALNSDVAWAVGNGGAILRSAYPSIVSISPGYGVNTGKVRIIDLAGNGFVPGVRVRLRKAWENDIEAVDVDVLSGDRITCEFDLTGASTGEWDVVVTGPDYGMDTLVRGFQVVDLKTWYLAEGSTATTVEGSFETWVLVENSSEDEAGVDITYMTPQGEVAGPCFRLAPRSRCTVDVSQTVGNTWSVSTRVDSDIQLVVERAMYFSAADGVFRQAAHGSIGVPCASRTWFLAEGSTGTNEDNSFETWVLVANPGTKKATVVVSYLTTTGEAEGPTFELEPGTRRTIDVADSVPGEWSISARVESDAPVVAERAVYWSVPGTFRRSAHDSIGAANPAREWFLAEGSTGEKDNGAFETWILVANPGDHPANVNVYYQTPEGQVEGPILEVGKHSRYTVKVSDIVPDTFSVSTRVVSDHPVVAERSMYWNTLESYRQAAHGSIGVTAPCTEWLLAEGSTGSDPAGCYETWILVQNPGTQEAGVHLQYMTVGGMVEGPSVDIKPGTRATFFVADTVPDTYSVSTRMISDQPVVAERALYWNPTGTTRLSAHESIGFAPYGAN